MNCRRMRAHTAIGPKTLIVLGILGLTPLSCSKAAGTEARATPESPSTSSTVPSETEKAPVGAGKAGAPCGAATECESGICEGQGCGPDAGRCTDKARACFRDLVQYCGCDDKTFQASSSCPGRRFKSRGACEPGEGFGVDLPSDAR